MSAVRERFSAVYQEQVIDADKKKHRNHRHDDSHKIHDYDNDSSMLQAQIKKSRSSRASTECQYVEICRKPDEEHLIESSICTVRKLRRCDASNNEDEFDK